LANGNLAMVSWYLIERACLSAISALSSSPTMRRLVATFDTRGHHFVIGGAHAVKLEPGHQLENVSPRHQATRRRRS
jgi:hypothetical protein